MLLESLKKHALILITVISLGGCVNGSRANSYCDIYDPIYISPNDTEETKKQVDGNNIVWVELCI